MLFGAAYYAEYQPYERLEEDIRLMVRAGVNCVRVGESTWGTWEPRDGHFEFDWMQRILDALHQANIKVILGTPTYAIPAWLHRKHPEIMAQGPHGHQVRYGARQNMDLSHPAYRFYCERAIRAIVGHFANHPAIIGYQIDNETGVRPLYNLGVFQSFVDYLKDKYGSVDRLNEVWGLTYWSHRLGDWADLWTPDDNTNPGYDLDWRRFQSSLTTDFLRWQANIVRELKRPDQFITHCFVGSHGTGYRDRYDVSQLLDIPADNPYHSTQDGLALPAADHAAWMLPEWSKEWGVYALYLRGDLARSGKGTNYLVTEVNAMAVGGHDTNFPAYDGQWRLAAYAFISRGANAISYWHWHTLHYGTENYWGGILNHDLGPNRCYRELSRLGNELKQHGDLLTDLEVGADVAFLYSEDSRYALEFQPCLKVPNSASPDRASYQRIFNTFYRSFFDARAQISVVHPPQDWERYPTLVAPALYVADDALLERLVHYADDGGHLVITFRTGYVDQYCRARWEKAPGPLRRAVGATYNEFSNLVLPLGLRAAEGAPDLPAEARAEAWADGLELEGATALAYYDHPHFGRFPAITTHSFGRGRVTYVGTLPNPALGKTLASWVLRQSGIVPLGEGLPESVRCTTARATDGKQLWFWSNWSFSPQTVPNLPIGGTELFTQARLRTGQALEMEPWGVRIVVAG